MRSSPLIRAVRAVAAAATLVALTVSGCAKDGATGSLTVADITVTPSTADLLIGEQIALSAVARDYGGGSLPDIPLEWGSPDPTIANVSETGQVTGVGVGEVTIWARSSGREGVAVVRVSGVAVASVVVAPSASTLVPDGTVQLTATARDAAGQPLADRPFQWASSNTDVATVSATGVVTGHASGTTTITATTQQVSGSAEVTVSAPVAAATLVGAGDIADCTVSTDEATALLLDDIAGTVFTAGDNAYPNGTDADFANCYAPTWGRHKQRTYPAVGNHEYYTTGAAGHFNYYGAAAGERGKGYYSYDLGAWHIVVLNSNIAAGVGSAQEQWLRADLAANPRTCTLAYFHHPRFSSGDHGNHTAMQAIWQALYDAGADVVISGHDHDYERFAPQTPTGQADPQRGIRQFVVGTGGRYLRGFGTIQPNSEVRNSTTHGVIKLTLRERDYDWQFIPVAGKTFTDAGTGGCH